MSRIYQLIRFNEYLINLLVTRGADEGRVAIELRNLLKNGRRRKIINYELSLKDYAHRISVDLSVTTLTLEEYIDIELNTMQTEETTDDELKKALHVWLGHTGKWKQEKPVEPKKKRGKNKLPAFTGDLTKTYISKGAFTHYYSQSRVTKGLTDAEKSIVEAGALLIYQAEKEWKGTRWRKVAKYNNCYVPRLLSEAELEIANRIKL